MERILRANESPRLSAAGTNGSDLSAVGFDVAMEVDLEMTGGVPAQMKCSIAQDAVRGAMFIARGDRGELTVINRSLRIKAIRSHSRRPKG